MELVEDDELATNVALEGLIFSTENNPLMIDTVLQSLFTFVDYNTLKECRQVCSKWKEISAAAFIKRSVFVVRRENYASLFQPLEDGGTLFRSIQEHANIRFSAFKFDYEILKPLVQEMYLLPSLTTMTQLEIRAASYWEANLEDNYNADELIGPNLVKLKLGDKWSDWSVSVRKLVSIRFIDLFRCLVLSNSDVKMAPQELTLANCELRTQQYPAGEAIKELSVFTDFGALRKLNVSQSGTKESSPILNLSDCCNIKSLSLKRSTLNLNGMISPDELILEDNWYFVNGIQISNIVVSSFISSSEHAHIRKMFIGDQDFARREYRVINEVDTTTFDLENIVPIDNLEVKECTSFRGLNPGTVIKKLKLCTRDDGSDFDLSQLPQSLETLEIDNDFYNPSKIVSSNPAHFPNLKQLFVKSEKCESSLLNFHNCPSLAYIELQRTDYNHFKILNSDHFPPNIKGLSLKNMINTDVVGSRVLKLEVLVLSHEYGVELLLDKMISYFQWQLAKTIRADFVIFNFKNYGHFKQYSTEDCINKIMNLQRSMSVGTVAFGPIVWESDDQLQNFNSLIDKMSDYYLFDGERGLGISETDMLKRIPFILHN